MQQLNEIKYKFYSYDELNREEIEYLLDLIQKQQYEIKALSSQITTKNVHYHDY